MQENNFTNVQIYPNKKRIELNDKATKILFNLTPDSYFRMIQNNSKKGIIEKKNHKKHGKIRSTFRIQNENGFTQIIELSEFDRAVFGVCISEWEEGNRHTTPAIILRGLTGKVNHKAGDAKPSTNQLTAILQSLDKMMVTTYDPDIIDAFEKLDYGDSDSLEKIKKAPLLPCKRVEKTINGQKADIIYFTDESPLLKIAKLKGQILTYDSALLDIPNQQNTPLIITLKNYVLRRILEIIKHPQMAHALTFDDIFTKCRIEGKHQEIKRRARDYIEEFFKHLQSKGVIKSFVLEKKGNKFHKISFTF